MEKEYKKLWTIIAIVETTPELTAKDIRSRIDQRVNEGDGMYFVTARNQCKIELIDTVEDI